jgi:hypothetical protein
MPLLQLATVLTQILLAAPEHLEHYVPTMKNKSKNYPSFTERSAVLRQRRNFKMASSAHAYVRGNTLKFYQWLAEANDGSSGRPARLDLR